MTHKHLFTYRLVCDVCGKTQKQIVAEVQWAAYVPPPRPILDARAKSTRTHDL